MVKRSTFWLLVFAPGLGFDGSSAEGRGQLWGRRSRRMSRIMNEPASQSRPSKCHPRYFPVLTIGMSEVTVERCSLLCSACSYLLFAPPAERARRTQTHSSSWCIMPPTASFGTRHNIIFSCRHVGLQY
jgi:hypothetical protein